MLVGIVNSCDQWLFTTVYHNNIVDNFVASSCTDQHKFVSNLSHTCINLWLCPSAIIGTWQEKGASIFWNSLGHMPLPSQVIMCWKAMLVIHKLLREGHPNVSTTGHRQATLRLCVHVAVSSVFSVIRNLISLPLFIFMFRFYIDHLRTCLFNVQSFKKENEKPW